MNTIASSKVNSRLSSASNNNPYAKNMTMVDRARNMKNKPFVKFGIDTENSEFFESEEFMSSTNDKTYD